MTDRSVGTHLDTVQTLGLIQLTERKHDNGSQTSNEYTLLFDAQNLPTPAWKTFPAPTPATIVPTLNHGIKNHGKEPNNSSSKDDEVRLLL